MESDVRPDTVGVGGEAEGPAASVFPSWLLKAKVVMPAPASNYVCRQALVRQVDTVLQRRLTVLQAPAGFGKTTVLADVSRRIRAQGHTVAWLTLDEDDVPGVFGSYVAYAFERAGLDLAAVADRTAWSSSPIARQTGLLARAIERHAAPCLLVLDELERLPRRTVGAIDLLLKRAPPNLHFAAAFRSNPGMDFAAHILDGSAVIVGASAFRFSRHEIAQFFRGDLSRRKLAAVEKQTAGWPVALIAYRGMQVREAGQPGAGTTSFTSNFVGVRLLRDLSAADRAFLLDLAIFDRIEADLVDEVLGSSDARLRIATLSALDGLLLPRDDDRAVQLLHPLVREYCVERFAVENPARKRSLHARTARALDRRGQLAPAWRHARSAVDVRLLGELIESAGIVGLWARGGTAQITAADGFLTPEIVEAWPRLAVLHCGALGLALKLDEAAVQYDAVARRTRGFTRDREGGDADALAFDALFARAALGGGASVLPRDAFDAGPEDGRPASGDDEPSRFREAARHALCCVASYERARFEESRTHGKFAQARFGEDARYGHIYLNVCLGMAAMAQGRVREASDRFRRARQGARRFFPSDPLLAATTEVVTIELDLERHREKAIQQRTLPDPAELRSGWTDIYAAAIEVRAELTFEQHGGEAAVKLLRRTVDDVRSTGRRRVLHHLSALLASYLVMVGRGDEAAHLWRDCALPCAAADLLDLDGQSWRTMEALSCARVRLLVDQGDCDAAGELAKAMCRAASAHGLVRTAMRSQALSVVAACHARAPDLAVERLTAHLGRLRDVDYFRPLVRDRRVSVSVLRRLLGRKPDAGLREAAESLLGSLDKRAVAAGPEFSAREQEILAEVRHGRRNKEIAERLGITEEGVRYHLKKIYRKTGVSRRSDAVRYALDKGVLT